MCRFDRSPWRRVACGHEEIRYVRRRVEHRARRVERNLLASARLTGAEKQQFLLNRNTFDHCRVARYMADFNTDIIEEFRANNGKVGGYFAGAPIVLVHHTGRKSGNEHVAPMMYMAAENPDTIYVFASKAGAPTHPDWYRNLLAAGRGTVEVGSDAGIETFDVTVRELPREERDPIYAEQARRYPGFADYEKKTAGIRIIPVLALTRA
jgi:deazaflavin-dependent oxidoreductase (nitroreductase family)